MLVLMVISCIIFQTCIAIYLFNINKSGDSFEKNLTRIMIVIVGQMCTKFLLLVILKDEMVYGRVSSGFAFAYGALVYIIAMSLTSKPLQRRQSLFLLLPFFISSAIYIVLVPLGFLQLVGSGFINGYTSIFQWFAVSFLLVYCTIAKIHLHRFTKSSFYSQENSQSKTRVINGVATLLMAGVSTGILCEALPFIKLPVWDFQFRVLPYSFFVFVPVVILKYKLEQKINKTSQPNNNGFNSHQSVLTEGRPLAQPTPAATLAPNNTAQSIVKRYEKSSLGEDTMDVYEIQLSKFVEKSKIYLNAELSLEELAQQVKIPKHHLTQLLNDRLKKNFYTYINECRIQEAQARLANIKTEVNILSLAYDCGFNSKSSFNNYFKKLTGYTPSAYRKLAETSTVENAKIPS